MSEILRYDLSEGRWTAFPKDTVFDSRLSLDTIGLMLFLFCHSDNWKILITALPGLLKDENAPNGHVGRHRLRRMLKQLERAGYLTRIRKQDSKGQWGWEIVLRPRPKTIDRKPVDGSSTDGSSGDRKAVDKPETNNTRNSTNKKEKQTTSPVPNEFGAELGVAFHHPFEGEQLTVAAGLLASCPSSQRQAVVDEVCAISALGKLRGNPNALLRRLIELARRGAFTSTYAVKMTEPSPCAPQVRRVQPRDRSGAQQLTKLSAFAEQTLASMRAGLQESDESQSPSKK